MSVKLKTECVTHLVNQTFNSGRLLDKLLLLAEGVNLEKLLLELNHTLLEFFGHINFKD